MKSAFEKNLFGVNQYSVINEENEMVAIFEGYYTGSISLENLCKKIGMSEELKLYESGQITKEDLEALVEEQKPTLLGRVGKWFANARNTVQANMEDISRQYNDARMPAQVAGNRKRLEDQQRRRALINLQREQRRQARLNPTQYQTLGTSTGATAARVEDAQLGTERAAAGHAANVKAQEIDDTRRRALAGGTDMYGQTPFGVEDVNATADEGMDSEQVDQSLQDAVNLLQQALRAHGPQRHALMQQVKAQSAELAKVADAEHFPNSVNGKKGPAVQRMNTAADAGSGGQPTKDAARQFAVDNLGGRAT